MSMQLLNTNSTSYKKLKELGEGSFGEVYLVQNIKNDQVMVSKEMKLQGLDEPTIIQLYTEVKVLENIKHPNIIEMHETYRTKSNKLVLILEHAINGDLAHYINSRKGEHISEEQIRLWAVQLCLALKHSHDHKIVHRDLKTSNVFLDADYNVKLGDFGLAKNLLASRQNNVGMTGTPLYLSPEAIKKGVCSYKGDIWSLGIVLYELCALENPFFATAYPALINNICEEPIKPLSEVYSQDLRDFIMSLLRRDDKLRPTIRDLFETDFMQNLLIKHKAEFRKLISVTNLSNVEFDDNGMKNDFAKMKVYRFSEYKDPNAMVRNIQHIVRQEEKVSKFKHAKQSIIDNESSGSEDDAEGETSQVVDDTPFTAEIKRNIDQNDATNNNSALLSRLESEEVLSLSQLKRQEEKQDGNDDVLLSMENVKDDSSETVAKNNSQNTVEAYDSAEEFNLNRDTKNSHENKVTIDTEQNPSQLLIAKNRQLLDSFFDNRSLLLSSLKTSKGPGSRDNKPSPNELKNSQVEGSYRDNDDNNACKSDRPVAGPYGPDNHNSTRKSKLPITLDFKQGVTMQNSPQSVRSEQKKSEGKGQLKKKSFFVQYKDARMLQNPLSNKFKISTGDRAKFMTQGSNKRQPLELNLESRERALLSQLSPVRSPKKGLAFKKAGNDANMLSTERSAYDGKSRAKGYLSNKAPNPHIIRLNPTSLTDISPNARLKPLMTPKKQIINLKSNLKTGMMTNNQSSTSTANKHINSATSNVSGLSQKTKRDATSIIQNNVANHDEYGFARPNHEPVKKQSRAFQANALDFNDIRKIYRASKISGIERMKSSLMEKYGNRFNLIYSGIRKFLMHHGLKHIKSNLKHEDRIVEMFQAYSKGRWKYFKSRKSVIEMVKLSVMEIKYDLI